ncbi:MAG TPA: DUF6602 domain-containing protein [Flavobacterium sp.]|uniref:DUF6602 domain-containing protein n=1 Tax=Flavobacterium sp. TaxID=239 RepID=UPI002DBEB70F|nr:DUF6602 domain-containing protein [Flavobacterium sp.]HEU4790302.1 DUF6602 domain-containing protein [Flavobacterium sp.]
MSNKIKIGDLFSGLQNQMVAQLNTNREFILHPGSKGDSLENVWIEWLRKYLPNRYCVDKAIIIDSTGSLSHQLDLVIYDQQYTPFVFTQNGIHYIPAEGVYAVFEVKPDLQGKVGDDNFFDYAGKKIESVRCLKRTSVKIINAGVEMPARPLTKIVGGILASTNSFTHSNNNTIESHLKNLKDLQTIEMGCAVDYGSFYVNYNGVEDISSKDFDKRINDYYLNRKFESVTFSDKENSLVTFFLQLTRYLQQSIGTVAAIDLNAYAKTIGFEIDQKI